MATHPIPDSNKEHMLKEHGTAVLITDPKANQYLNLAHRRILREKKRIVDSWTI